MLLVAAEYYFEIVGPTLFNPSSSIFLYFIIEIASQAKESEDATAALDDWTIEIGGKHHFSKFLHSFGHLAKTRRGRGEACLEWWELGQRQPRPGIKWERRETFSTCSCLSIPLVG